MRADVDPTTGEIVSSSPPTATPWANRITGFEPAYPVDELLANPYNFKMHSGLQQQATTAALERVGWVQPITLNTVTGHLLDGHMRVLLAMRHGEATVPVILVRLNPEQEKEALIYIYQTAAYGSVDRDLLRDVLQDVRQTAAELSSRPAIRQMFDDLAKYAKKALPLPPEPATAPPDDDEREPLFANGDARPLAQQQRVQASAPEAQPVLSGRGNVALTEREHSPERFALSIVLTKTDKRRWDTLKEALQARTDSQGLITLLDKLDSGELMLAGEE